MHEARAMLKRMAIRIAACAFALALFAGPCVTSAAPAGLVLDGTEIVDGPTYDAAKKEAKLLLYSTYESHGMAQIIAKFQADTGLSVDVIRLPSAEMFDRATSEFATHRLSADYVDTTDVSLTQQLAERGILRGYKVPGFGGLEPVLHDADGHWYDIIRSTMAIGVNTALVKPADVPSKWTDLLDPKWKGKIGFGNIDAGGTAYSFWFFMHQKYGADAWHKIAAQTPRIGYSAQPVATDLARGETVIAVDPIESLISGIASGSPLKIVLPPGGPSYGIIGGITSIAPHPHAAQVWMNWITSKRASTVLGAIGAYSIRRDAAAPVAAGVTMPGPASIYNIRASDYTSAHAALIKEWHGVFSSH